MYIYVGIGKMTYNVYKPNIINLQIIIISLNNSIMKTFNKVEC